MILRCGMPVILAVVVVACFSAWSPAASGADRGGLRPSLDDDGMLIVGGERMFVLGCYWNPGTAEGLARLRDAGFNLVMAKADRAALDQVAQHDLLAWIPLGGSISPASEADDKRLESLVRPLLDHPALAVWEVPDEALWNAWYGRSLRLAEERRKLRAMRDDQKKAGRDTGRVTRLMKEAADARARADWTVAEALDRQIRELLNAPPQNPDMQMSAAPQAAESLRKRLLRGYRLLHQLDGRPVWMNYAPRNTPGDLQSYAEAADIVGCDIYPAPVQHSQRHSDLVNRQITSVGDYTDRFRIAGGGRPVWMVLQGFGWRDIHAHPEDAPPERGRRPTQDESRLMLYDAIVHGSRGVLYWGSQYAQDPPDFWDDLCKVVHEAAELQHVWAARDADTQPRMSYLPTLRSVDRPPLALAKQLEDQQYILVVNEHDDGLGVRLEGLEGLNDSQASLFGNADGCQLKTDLIQKGSLVIHMPGLSAAVVVLKQP